MTVLELIDILNALPEDYDVVWTDGMDVTGITLDKTDGLVYLTDAVPEED